MAGTILTNIGLSKLATATPQNQLNITHIAVGDGNGGFPTLTPSMTALTNEVWRGDSSNPVKDSNGTNYVYFETNIPPEVGPFDVREIACFDSDGDMIAIGHTSLIQKPDPVDDSNFSVATKIFIALENASDFDLIYQNTEVTSHNTLADRNAIGAHDDIYSRNLNCIKDLETLTGFAQEGQKVSITGFYDGTTVGGGDFVYQPLMDRDDHNGGTVISPDAVAAWDGTHSDLVTLLDWSGEGTGCWVRSTDAPTAKPEISPAIFGGADLHRLPNSDVRVNLPKGVYTLSAPINPSDGLEYIGAGQGETVITSPTKEVLLFTGDAKEVTFKELSLVSTAVDANNSVYGIVRSLDHALKNIRFDSVTFNVPDANTNAVKIIVQTENTAEKIYFNRCNFENIGRMAIEFQNHVDIEDKTERYKNVEVTWCTFKNIGLSGDNGMGVSLSGYGTKCVVDHNTFDNCLQVAIEPVGVQDSSFSHNTFQNMTRECDPISASGARIMEGNKYVGNVCRDIANGRVNLYSQKNATVKDNLFKVNFMFFRDITGSTIADNVVENTGVYSLYMEGYSTGNTIENTTLDNTQAVSNFSLIRFATEGTTGNVIRGVRISPDYKGGQTADQILGAAGNYVHDVKFLSGARHNSHYRTKSMPDADYDVSAIQEGVVIPAVLRLNGTLTDTRTVTMPEYTDGIMMYNTTTHDLEVVSGSTLSKTLAVGESKTFFFDGTSSLLL